MNLFQLRAFDAVAREGSFTRAAERLCISQPAVTGHVKALEEHYQVTLFRRTARRIELTEGGLAPGGDHAHPVRPGGKKPRPCSTPIDNWSPAASKSPPTARTW